MALQRIVTEDKNLKLLQDYVDQALTQLQNSTFSGGVLLKDVSLASGQDNLISHSLGRVPSIVFNGTPNLNSVIWTATTSSLNGAFASREQINLKCSASCIVSVWVK